MINMETVYVIGIFVGGYLFRAIAEKTCQRRKEELRKAELRGIKKERDRQRNVSRERNIFETSRDFGINREGVIF